ncbi:flagellar biosynthetic protein FliR [Bacillus sp. 2205SS5-2]|uniref:flagellar biosynthetic protein FliR n=1 Tax=Bacillus sp. 2205SS5-2 TaxID=3109031 RepID=UPI0030041FFA
MDQIVPIFSVFLLIFVRVASFFVTMPLFSYRTIPAQHRIGFSAIIAWIMYYVVAAEPIPIDGIYFLLILKESMVGLLVGFAAYMIISAIQIAGGFIDFQMGFSIANVVDPQTGGQTPITGQYLYTFALLLLLALNGHHLLLDGIYYSYEFIPLNQAWLPFKDPALAEYMITSFSAVFAIAFQMAAPVVATLFLVDIALGIVARTVPQLNIFVVGFPIKIGVSFVVLFIVMGVMMALIGQLFELMLVTMREFMVLLGSYQE